MVSTFSSHFFNWVKQLESSGHQIYWLDVYDSNTKVKEIEFVEQIIGWRYKLDFKGRSYLKQNYPKLYSLISKFNERDFKNVFRDKLEEVKPDVVHSFSMQMACYPIAEIMKENRKIKWIYSSWGSDIYYYHKINDFSEARRVMHSIDFMFSDCYRDFYIARENNFKGEFLGKFPGRGGFEIEKYKNYIIPFHKRNIILIKGYQRKHGRCIEVLRGLYFNKEDFQNYQITVFGADNEVVNFVEQNSYHSYLNLTVLKNISHDQVMQLMGRAKIYIGNSQSDGMPNSLLEAIIMEAYPVQSNPGGVTEELLTDNKNGRLINNPLDIEEIAALLKQVIQDDLLEDGIKFNSKYIRPNLERELIKRSVLEAYCRIEKTVR
ncbi:MAG: glycosyl transferase family 1 [Zunongwangia sp.]|jgi:hypothetical protein|nr:glycosyl transferase family 1 [Zunongwangia sp.]|tara:strand:+ start:13032 stop:14162 length:1131 start_codon:yes stop_codon:yes gene_type:complete